MSRTAILSAALVTSVGTAMGCGGEEPGAGGPAGGPDGAGAELDGDCGSNGDAGEAEDARNCDSSWYGPMMCDADTQCEDHYGAGWYCDEDRVFHDPCGNPVKWPMCTQHDAGNPDALDASAQDTVDSADEDADAAAEAEAQCDSQPWYGPKPCDADTQCEQDHGAGWYCDEDHEFTDWCGSVKWPMCVAGQTDAASEPDACEDSPIDCGVPDAIE